MARKISSRKPTRSRKLTPNQKLYKDQIHRLTRAANKLVKEGYLDAKDLIPSMPKVVTKKKIEEIKKITPDILRGRSKVAVSPEGEVLTGKELRRQQRDERKQRRKKTKPQKPEETVEKKKKTERVKEPESQMPALSDIILDQVWETIESYPNASYYLALKNFMNGLLASQGKEAVVQALQKCAEETGYTVSRETLYNAGGEYYSFRDRMLRYLPEVGPRTKEMLEEAEYNGETFEQYDYE